MPTHAAPANAFDLWGSHLLNQFAGHSALDGPMKFLAHYGLELYAVVLLVAWFALPRRDEQHRHGLVLAVVGAVLALMVNLVIGALWHR
ncbi:MAG: hypothetical protein K6T31_02480 [Alicyclobacillus sp.]|nr:hypothetical protein [Alicyclobacillus sp.]